MTGAHGLHCQKLPILSLLQSYSLLSAGGASGLLVMGVADYLASYWPQLVELTALVESLEASLQGGGAEREGRRGEYSEHLPEQALLEGVKKVCVCMGGRGGCVRMLSCIGPAYQGTLPGRLSEGQPLPPPR